MMENWTLLQVSGSLPDHQHNVSPGWWPGAGPHLPSQPVSQRKLTQRQDCTACVTVGDAEALFLDHVPVASLAS